jgi:hypothetical protein
MMSGTGKILAALCAGWLLWVLFEPIPATTPYDAETEALIRREFGPELVARLRHIRATVPVRVHGSGVIASANLSEGFIRLREDVKDSKMYRAHEECHFAFGVTRRAPFNEIAADMCSPVVLALNGSPDPIGEAIEEQPILALADKDHVSSSHTKSLLQRFGPLVMQQVGMSVKTRAGSPSR